MVRVIGFLVVAGLLAAAAAAQPYVVAGDLEGTLICDELGQGMTYQQQIAIANPLVLQKEFRFAFAIRATASGPVSGVSVTFLNGFLDFAPHAHASVE